jgi:hypothetical protein
VPASPRATPPKQVPAIRRGIVLRALPPLLLAAGLLAPPEAPAAPPAAGDHVAWGRIRRLVGGGERAVVVPDRGAFVEESPVALYDGSRQLCTGVVRTVYKDCAYVDLEAACREAEFDREKALVVMGATYHEISRNFTEREAMAVTDGMAEKVRSGPVDVKGIFVRLDGKQGLSATFALLDSSGRLAAADGTARIRIVLPGEPGQGGKEPVLYDAEHAVARTEFRRGRIGPGADSDELLTWHTGTIPYGSFDLPPPRKPGTRGKLILLFRNPDGSAATGSTLFSFDGAN